MTTRSGPDAADSGRGRPDPDLDAVMGERRPLINLTYRETPSMDDGLTRVFHYHQVRSEPPPPSLAASQDEPRHHGSAAERAVGTFRAPGREVPFPRYLAGRRRRHSRCLMRAGDFKGGAQGLSVS
jgi:hypothetical protein